MLLPGHDAHKNSQNQALPHRRRCQPFQLRDRHREFCLEALGVRARLREAPSPFFSNDVRHFADVEERQDVVSRLGWMLVFNPLEVRVWGPSFVFWSLTALAQLDGFYRFELHRRDEREIVKMLVDLSVREPGEVCTTPFSLFFCANR